MMNTKPKDYVVNLAGMLRVNDDSNTTPSQRVVLALLAARPEISAKRFRTKVFDAIFQDAVEEAFFDEMHRQKLLARLERRFGRSRTKQILIQRCDILHTWKYRDSRFVPDAFWVDAENKTVVCYEVEDTHPLNPFSIGEYAAAWYTLEYIYWDLHLIAYDIYGHPRIIVIQTADFIAQTLREQKRKWTCTMTPV